MFRPYSLLATDSSRHYGSLNSQFSVYKWVVIIITSGIKNRAAGLYDLPG